MSHLVRSICILGLLSLLVAVQPCTATLAVEEVGTPPGAPEFAEELRLRLAAGLAARGADYLPRTRHKREDGSPEFTNRLILESSPYLLQHAHNPVNWYPWGDAAFAEARRLGRPVLLSIGYSTCHWCHVMEEESFEDKEIAEFLNANYIAIKVDREERPDIDAVYMRAVQMLNGRGGWPMTTWLTPDREPFFGGTYYPARDGDRGSGVGFLTLLRQLKETYDTQPAEIAGRAKQVSASIRRAMTPAASHAAFVPAEVLGRALARYEANFDSVHGGMRRAPKFPSSLPIRLLLQAYARSGKPELLEMARLTLTKMANGGIHDHIGGGFHRYSVDAQWLAPHFEKMLYDNALLSVSYLEGYQATGEAAFAEVARDTLRYVLREMTAPEGGFYSATDADSRNPDGESEEGWFFTWTPAEIVAVLGAAEARKVQAYYGVTERGNFEGRNIFNVTRSLEEVSAMLGVPAERLAADLERSRQRLYEARARRPAPLRDDKVLAAWNGLMISAMARGGFVLDEGEFTTGAIRAAEFVLGKMSVDGRLRRSYMDGRARHNAYLDDYAFVAAGLLDLFEVTANPRWLREAIRLHAVLDQHYADAGGGYFMTSTDHETTIAREKPAYDGAEPSGNSVALMNLVRLHELTSDDRYRLSAGRLRGAFGASLERNPTGLSEMLLAIGFDLGAPREVVVVTSPSRADAGPFFDVLRRSYVPNKVVAIVDPQDGEVALEGLVPLAMAKPARDGQTTAYVCERGVCKLPTTEPDEFRRQLLQKADESPAPSPGE